MTDNSDLIASLAQEAAAEYDDEIAVISEALLVGCGRCYGFTENPEDSTRRNTPLYTEAMMSDLAWKSLAPKAQVKARQQNLVYARARDRLEEEMLRDVRELVEHGSPWASMSVNSTYLLSALTAPKPESDEQERSVHLSIREIDKVFRSTALDLKVDARVPETWRWGAVRLVWEVTLKILEEHPSPYFTTGEADMVWERAIAASIAETTANRPKGHRRTAPKLWNLFHPPQPDSEPPRENECLLQTDYPSMTISISLDGSTSSTNGGGDSEPFVERGVRMYDGAPTEFYQKFVQAMRHAASNGDPYAHRVARRVDSETWWTKPKRKKGKVVPREKEIGKRAKQLLTLDRRGRSLLFALGLDHKCAPMDAEMAKARKALLSIESMINEEKYDEESQAWRPPQTKKLHKHAVGRWMKGLEPPWGDGYYMFPAIPGWSYVGGDYKRAGFTVRERQRVWYTTLVRDVFVMVSPLLENEPSVLFVRDKMAVIVTELEANPFDGSEGAVNKQQWLVIKAVWSLCLELVGEMGSKYLSKDDANQVWGDMMAAVYKWRKNRMWELPKGSRRSEALRLGFEAHRATNVNNEVIELAGARGDSWAQKIIDRSLEIKVMATPRGKSGDN